MTANNQYYNYMNLREYMDKLGITAPDDWLRWFKDLAVTKITQFYYDNLPDKLTSEIVETALMYNNHLCLANVEGIGIILCRYIFGSTFDIYWKPEYVDLLALNGKTVATNVPYSEIVIVRDNPSDIIPFMTLRGWLDKILDKEKTLDILVQWVRLPTLLVGDKDQATALKQLMKKVTNYEGFAIGTKGFKNHIEQFNVSLPCRLEEISHLIEKYKNMALNSIGIYGADEKQERLLVSEVQATNDYTDFVYSGMYNERLRWVKEANDKFGLSIKMHETYVDNEKYDIANKRQMSMAMAQGTIAVKEVENEGKIEAARVSGVEAAKEEAKGEKQA